MCEMRGEMIDSNFILISNITMNGVGVGDQLLTI